jgi:ABC-type polysaccharide/polyol phosphate export permease
VPERFRGIMGWNPLAHLVRMYRAAILEGHVPAVGDVVVFAAWAVGIFLAGYVFFTRNHWKLADLV